MKWPKVRLDSVCESISDGDHLAPPKSVSGVPFITISNIDGDNNIDFTRCMYVPRSYYENVDCKRKPQKGDVLYSVVGSFGKPVLMRENTEFVFQRHIAILRPKADMLSSRFLYATMLSPAFYALADAVAVGTAQRTVSLSSLRGMEISLPPLPIQQKIAEVLGAYDDLIENNRRRIALLEKMARELYRERFVRRKGNRRLVSINEVCTVQYGYAFNGKLFNETGNGLPIIRIRNIPLGQSSDFTCEEAPDCYRVTDGEILVGMDGEFHINLWSGGEAFLVQRSCCFRPFDKSLKGYLIEAIRAPIKYFESAAMGATVGHLGKKDIDTITISLPSEGEKRIFAEWFDERLSLALQNRNLAKQRDRLLPRLMSGRLEVRG